MSISNPVVPHEKWFNLAIRPLVGKFERVVGFLNDVCQALDVTHKILVANCEFEHPQPFPDDTFTQIEPGTDPTPCILLLNPFEDQTPLQDLAVPIIHSPNVRVVVGTDLDHTNFDQFPKHLRIRVVSKSIHHIPLVLGLAQEDDYQRCLHYFNCELGSAQPSTSSAQPSTSSAQPIHYDNLINLCIMVKNGGDTFETVLRENLDLVDRWTVLDTGSTDGTQEVVRRVLGQAKRGQLFEEPFVNFRDSRNRCLDLAGTSCKYNIMLDDTYVVRGAGRLREFLEEVRGDEFASSFCLTFCLYTTIKVKDKRG
jgi:hypothetical protein